MEEMSKARQGMGKGHEAPMLWVHHCLQMSTYSPIWKLSGLYPFVFLWRLYYIGMID